MQSPYARLQFYETFPVTQFLSALCALGLLAGALAFARHGANDVSFVELGAAVPPSGAVTLPV